MAMVPFTTITEVEPRLRLQKITEHHISDCVEGPDTAHRFLRHFLGDMAEETVCVLMLDNRNRPIHVCTVAKGSINTAYVSGREIFKACLLTNCTSIVLSHCHPSGDPSPSMTDTEITKTMLRAGIILGIPLLDHIIVSGNKSFSYLLDDAEHFHQMVEEAKKEYRED